jgi:hypothetical protein
MVNGGAIADDRVTMPKILGLVFLLVAVGWFQLGKLILGKLGIPIYRRKARRSKRRRAD